MKLNAFERIVSKLTSARYVITIMMSTVFAYLAVTEKLTSEFISVFMLVISFYFNKKREDNLSDSEDSEELVYVQTNKKIEEDIK